MAFPQTTARAEDMETDDELAEDTDDAAIQVQFVGVHITLLPV